MKIRSRIFLLIILIIAALYFIYPSFLWYFVYTKSQKDEVSISREKLKDLVLEKVDISINKLNKNEKLTDDEVKTIYTDFIKELKERNIAIKKANQDAENYNKKNPNDNLPKKDLIAIKKTYTIEEIKEIQLSLKAKEKRVESFFRESLENYHDKLLTKRKDVKDKIIKLGLDLQGGAYAVITVNFNHPKVKEEFKDGLSKEVKDSMINNAMLKIQNRIGKWGVEEIDIKKLSEQEKIAVSLPGVKEISSLKQIIETVGVLDFKLVSDEGTTAFTKIFLEARAQGKPTFNKDKTLLPEYQAKLDAVLPNMEVLFKSEKDKFGVEKEEVPFYVVVKDSLLGKNVKISTATVDKDNWNNNVVSFVLEGEDAKKWAVVTGNNVGKKIAIILDDYVLHAPVVQEKIPNGRSQIRLGDSPLEDLRNLALILRAGSLNVPLEISEEQVVGPSLGKDTIDKGLRSIFIGLLAVVAFMAFYYLLGGLIADFALALNLFFLTAGLALFNATLTLPGIAGYILTVGMSVDANVIIFERIKEEFKSGKPFATALNLGYDKAFWAIFDSNITTFAAGFGLTLFGTGAVKGFAVTLCLGIVVSMYTSLVITKIILDIIAKYKEVKSIHLISLFKGK